MFRKKTKSMGLYALQKGNDQATKGKKIAKASADIAIKKKKKKKTVRNILSFSAETTISECGYDKNDGRQPTNQQIERKRETERTRNENWKIKSAK